MISNQSLKLKLNFQSKAVLSLFSPLEEPEGWEEEEDCVCVLGSLLPTLQFSFKHSSFSSLLWKCT